VAIFAPGWVLENNTRECDEFCTADGKSHKIKRSFDDVQKDFFLESCRLWEPIKLAWMVDRFDELRLPTTITFAQGCGRNVFIAGQSYQHWAGQSCTYMSSAAETSAALTEHFCYYDLSMQRNNWNMSCLLDKASVSCEQMQVNSDTILDFDCGQYKPARTVAKLSSCLL
jgi:hypothetical protein